MDTCIICGIPAEGNICPSHAEDVFFEFEGDSSEQLVLGRYYQGEVDGIADFGVFVKLNDKVTGLLHRNELKQRLESLGWEKGDIVYVKVKSIREVGKIDLGWSIRQNENEFRGCLSDGERKGESGDRIGEILEDSEWEGKDDRAGFQGTPIEMLEKELGKNIRIDARILDIRQTTGPTLFEMQDESGKIICSAFESAGKRVYPELKVGDIVRIEGKVELRRGNIQVESDSIVALGGDDAERVVGKISEVMYKKSHPGQFEPVVDNLVDYSIVESAATEIRMAIFESTPIIIRHPTTVDGYIAGATIEHAIIRLVEQEYGHIQSIHRYVERRPYQPNRNEIGAAILDTSRMLESQLRYNDPIPLYIFVSGSGNIKEYEGLRLIEIYGGKRIVVGGKGIETEHEKEYAEVLVKSAKGEESINLTSLSVEIAVAIDPEKREEVLHTPAISYWEDVPERYAELADSLGYELGLLKKIHRSIAVEAFYQRNSSKREMISDILFGENLELIDRCNAYFVENMEKGILTASLHLDRLVIGENKIATIDLDKFTNRYQFPPEELLLLGLIEEESIDIIIGNRDTELLIESKVMIDLKRLCEDIKRKVGKENSIDLSNILNGRISFVQGDRQIIRDEIIGAISDQL